MSSGNSSPTKSTDLRYNLLNMAETHSSIYSKTDYSSLSCPNLAVSTHIKLEWDLDFEQQKISGSVEHVVEILVNGTFQVDFDSSSSLNIVGNVLVDGEVGSYTLSDEHPTLGRKISVAVPSKSQVKGCTVTIKIEYYIDNKASAVQWLDAAATKGGKLPYLFTQSQAIHARSLLPCMDSPGVKTPYTAIVTAPKWCTVLMSALQSDASSITSSSDPEKSTFVWIQPVPTPAYLIALAAGNLASRDISDRVRIWAEPEVVDAATYEFAETEDFLRAAEELTCPYAWGRYDVLCLPPSCPYGGMENPCLTFVTPTLLAGDRSLSDVIAHEIAHSWTGNLITNHTWDHFYLNEGWTVWLERKITSRVKGSSEHGKLSAQIGWKHLQDDINRMGETNPFTCLVWPLTGEDPDDAFSSVPYEKGFNLLNYLEGIVGEEDFSLFVKAYIDKFKFSTVTSGDFRDLFVSFFHALYTEVSSSSANSNGDTAVQSSAHGTPPSSKKKKNNKKKPKNKTTSSPQQPDPRASPSTVDMEKDMIRQGKLACIDQLDWDSLLRTPGLPTYAASTDGSDTTPITPDFTNSLSASALSLAEQWISYHTGAEDHIPISSIDGWSSQQISIFLESFLSYCETMSEDEAFSADLLCAMDTQYSFSSRKNSEIMFRWQLLCLGSEMQWIVPQVVSFVTSQGRMKFVRPLYRALRASDIGKRLAVETFVANKYTYHPIARKMIETDLKKAAVEDGEMYNLFDEDEEGEEIVVSIASTSNGATGASSTSVEVAAEVVDEVMQGVSLAVDTDTDKKLSSSPAPSPPPRVPLVVPVSFSPSPPAVSSAVASAVPSAVASAIPSAVPSAVPSTSTSSSSPAPSDDGATSAPIAEASNVVTNTSVSSSVANTPSGGLQQSVPFLLFGAATAAMFYVESYLRKN